MIEGLIVTPLKRIHTPKGYVLHGMKATDAGFCGFGEVYFSQIKKDELKGWKRHNRFTLNIVVVSGTIRFYLEDTREASPTNGQKQTLVLSPNGLAFDEINDLNKQNISQLAEQKPIYARITIPAGVWVAFEGVVDSMLMDIIPEPHDPTEADTK